MVKSSTIEKCVQRRVAARRIDRIPFNSQQRLVETVSENYPGWMGKRFSIVLVRFIKSKKNLVRTTTSLLVDSVSLVSNLGGGLGLALGLSALSIIEFILDKIFKQ